MEVAVFNKQRVLSIPVERVAPLVREVVSLEGRAYDEVGIHFIGAAAMRRLHRLYFDDPSLTDCISFPAESIPGYRPLGDVFICPQAAIQYMDLHGGDVYQETTLYLVHGLLHLMGYDDIKEKEKNLMRAAEERQMSHLRKKRLILHPKN